MSDSDDEPDGFTHRITTAAGAPRHSTSAPNSVFALGGGQAAAAEEPAQAQAPVPQGRGERMAQAEREARALQHIEACGELTTKQLAQVMQIGPTVAARVVTNLIGRKAIKVTRKEATTPFYGLRKGGLGEHLARAAGASKPARAPRQAVAPAGAAPSAPADWQAALYSTGAVMIEAGGQQVHLPRDSARGLLAWLLKIDQAVQA